MILFGVLAVVVAIGVLVASIARGRGAPSQSSSATALRVGSGIALLRLLIFYCGLYLIGFGDSRQVVGYFMLILNSVIELQLASLLFGRRPEGQVLTAVLIGVTSILLGYGWTWLRFRSKPVSQ